MDRQCRNVSIVVMMLIFVVGGCKDETPITSYEEPRTRDYSQIKKPDVVTEAAKPVNERILAGLVPSQSNVWFVKMIGAAKSVETQKENFVEFLKSFSFDANGAPSFSKPDAWGDGEKGSMRYASYNYGSGKEVVDISVIPLPASDLLENVNRWRGQVGLGPITPAQLKDYVNQVQAGSLEIPWVDINSVAEKAAANDGTKNTVPTPEPAPKPVVPEKTQDAGDAKGGKVVHGGMEMQLPAGWVLDKQPRAMRRATVVVSEGELKAELSIIPLPGSVGGLTANINRWRNQVGLESVSAAEIEKAVKPVEIFSKAGKWVAIEGAKVGDTQRAILGALVDIDGSIWFIKMTGDAKLVMDQRAAFMSYIQTIKFVAGGGGG